MIIRGKITGGVVVFKDPSPLPEGTEVEVTPCNDLQKIDKQDSIWEKLLQLSQWAETSPGDLPEDLAANHDHYLHGLPKRT